MHGARRVGPVHGARPTTAPGRHSSAGPGVNRKFSESYLWTFPAEAIRKGYAARTLKNLRLRPDRSAQFGGWGEKGLTGGSGVRPGAKEPVDRQTGGRLTVGGGCSGAMTSRTVRCRLTSRGGRTATMGRVDDARPPSIRVGLGQLAKVG